MKTAILATLIAGAAAFAPTQVAKTTTSLNAFENELGAQERCSEAAVDEAGAADDTAGQPGDRPRIQHR